MDILEKIVQTKKEEIKGLKKIYSLEKFQETPFFNRECISLKEALLIKENSGIIAEFKLKSPSKGIINQSAHIEEVTKGYAEAGATGLSVLTDFEYFGGNMVNLVKARETNPEMPILRKDFIIDPFQLYEAKAFGADVILLIAACLEKKQLNELAETAKTLGLDVLVEIHHEGEIEKISSFTDIVGVNNRNLKTFYVDINTSIHLSKLIPDHFVKISESGLSETKSIVHLKEYGFKGFLMGESFMKTDNPAQACKNFIQNLQN